MKMSRKKAFFLMMPLIFFLAYGCVVEDDEDRDSGEVEEVREDDEEDSIGAENEADNGEGSEDINFGEFNVDEWRIEAVATDLEAPWSIAKSEDDLFFITERDGQIVQMENGEMRRESLNLEENVWHEGEAGLLGMVLHPDSQDSAIIYHTYETAGDVWNRIVEIERLEEGWQEISVLLDRIPGDAIHNGGRLAIGPDDYLYATTGDANETQLSQDPESLAGNILRLDLDGAVPDDNPFEDSYVYSYGHRNPQGLDWDEDGQLYSAEHGPTGHDEVNQVEPGKNYGWPEIIGDEEAEGMEVPLFHSGDETWAPSGAAFADGNFFITGLAGEELLRFDVDTKEMDATLSDEGRLRDVFIEGDEMYVLTNNTDGRGSPEENDDCLLRISKDL